MELFTDDYGFVPSLQFGKWSGKVPVFVDVKLVTVKL